MFESESKVRVNELELLRNAFQNWVIDEVQPGDSASMVAGKVAGLIAARIDAVKSEAKAVALAYNDGHCDGSKVEDEILDTLRGLNPIICDNLELKLREKRGEKAEADGGN